MIKEIYCAKAKQQNIIKNTISQKRYTWPTVRGSEVVELLHMLWISLFRFDRLYGDNSDSIILTETVLSWYPSVLTSIIRITHKQKMLVKVITKLFGWWVTKIVLQSDLLILLFQCFYRRWAHMMNYGIIWLMAGLFFSK